MDRETTRRAVLGALVGAGVAGGYLSPAQSFLDRFAPLSGSVWGASRTSRQETVQSPHGPAEVRYDEYGVPQVSADDEQALYFAVGYVQATDRLFQMDLQRRLYSGRLSEVVGDVALESDRFHRKMAFREAAEVTAENLSGTPVEPALDAYVDGVNAAMENEPLPVEFRLLEYEPAPWTRTDSALVEKLIAWQLTGGFRTLRVALVREAFGEGPTSELFPARFDHDVPIIRDFHEAGPFGNPADPTAERGAGGDSTGRNRSRNRSETAREGRTVDKPLVDWLGQFEPSPLLGSNSWIVGPEHTDGDAPIVANDPHLSLQAPPVWYEMHVDGPAHRARGVAFPGSPFVIIGENDHGAWGFTNANSDVIDFYRYDHDGETYQYGDERREFDVREEEIPVAGGDNQTVEVRKSVHGPVIERAEQEVGVAWTGHTATETTLAIYQLGRSTGIDEALAAAGRFDCPTQNFVYGDRDGNTLYYMTGRLPVRWTDGERVAGDRVFDGSAREGEWRGFEPFGESSWDGFVPVSENPTVVNPPYLATANQQIVDDDRVNYYLADSYTHYYRGKRIYDLLDERVASGESVDIDFLQTVGRDTYDGRAADLVDPLVEAAQQGDRRMQEYATILSEWDYRMEPDSRAALVFDVWLSNYVDELLGESFEEAGLGEQYYPWTATIAGLSPDSSWFGPAGRAVVMRRALRRTIEDLDDSDHEVYGDVNHTGHIDHPLELGFLGYDDHPRGGSGWTVRNYRRDGPWGGSWEMQADLDGDLLAVLPGGNDGRYFSPHYDDQIQLWADGEYRQLSRDIEGDLTVEFEEGER